MLPRSYSTLPRIPDAGLLQRYLETLGVIAPLARTNLVRNPSFETNSTGVVIRGTVAGSTRTTDQSYHGAYSFAITPSTAATTNAMNGGFAWGSLDPVANATFAVSAKFRGSPGVAYRLYVENSVGSIDLATYRFVGTGRWQWIWLVYQEAAVVGGSRNYVIIKDNNRDGGVFYIDGLQVELITDGYLVPTTYIDGDQPGLVANQYPPAYFWTGTPHASSSSRSGQTRAGGRIVRFKDLGFLLTTIIGLGMAPPAHQALTFAQLDGGQYQNTLKPPRTFSLAGRVASATPNGADAALAQIGVLLDRDLIAQRQPLVLTMQAQECGVDCGERVFVQALYSGGLEGQVSELPTYQVPISFTQYLSYITGGSQGAALDVQDAIASPGGILARAPNGTWAALGTGVSGGGVRAIVVGLDGLVYVGGTFTNAGGTGADYIASYNPQTGTWSSLFSATALNGAVQALSVGPDGRIYVGGNFTNASGIAAADYIAVWDPSASSWAALGTGMNGVVNALAWVGSTLYAGGDFTTAGGGAAARVAGWNGSAWSALGSGASTAVQALASNGRLLYIGGDFVNGGGVAAADFIGAWNPITSSWSALSTGMNSSVNALAVAPNGTLYASGTFTTAGGITAGGIAVWNGTGWQPVGSGFSSPGSDTASDMVALGNGTLLIAANSQVIDPGTPGYIFLWNGSAYVSLGLAISGGEGTALAVAPDGTIYAGVNGTNVAAGLTSVTNSGTIDASPQVIIRGPSSGTSRLYELINRTTGAALYLNYTIAAGETLTLTLNPTNVTLVSTFRGNVLSAILPGSQSTLFSLQPGPNAITFLADSSTVTAVMQSQIGYNRLNDALYQAVAP